jgi:hypothetical protein
LVKETIWNKIGFFSLGFILLVNFWIVCWFGCSFHVQYLFDSIKKTSHLCNVMIQCIHLYCFYEMDAHIYESSTLNYTLPMFSFHTLALNLKGGCPFWAYGIKPKWYKIECMVWWLKSDKIYTPYKSTPSSIKMFK